MRERATRGDDREVGHRSRRGGCRTATTALATLLTLAAASAPAAAQEANAGGASGEEVVLSLIGAGLFLAGAAGFAFAYRRGKLTSLDRVAALNARAAGQPSWAALPLTVAGVSLVVAVFGFYWDVATHIDHGRDEGIFGNAAHWPILVGLTGLAIAGLISVLLGTDPERSGAVEVPGERWHGLPVGGVLLALCGVVALIGFPIDDVWHRIFGQDVTLWSPPHIQMVAGASLCTLAMWVLFVEAERAQPHDRLPRRRYLIELQLAGAVLVGLSTLQGEFDFGVPQFRLLFQPLLIAGAAGVALVAARIRLGRGGAVGAVAFFLLLRGALSVVVSGMFDHLTFHMPLYLGAALVVELVALRVRPDRQLTFGALAGLGIGTVGILVEAAWTHVWMPIGWPSAMLPEAALIVPPTAVAAGVVGGFLGRALTRPGTPRQTVPSWVAPTATVVLVAAIAYPLRTVGLDAVTQMSLTTVAGPSAGEHVEGTFRIEPADALDDPEWLHVIAWQGAGWWSEEATQLVELEAVGEGVYRTTGPIPVHGEWKAMLRVHDGQVMAAAPIFLPEDPAIPAEEVPVELETTRAFVPDHEVLLREARETAPWVPVAAQALMALIGAAWIAAFVWGTRRLRLTRPDDRDELVIDLADDEVPASRP